MGLIVHPRTADVRRRGADQEFFLDRVLVEPREGEQPPGDRGAGPALRFQVPGEALDVGPADGEQRQGPAQHQLVNWRRSSAYASRVRPRYPARKPARATCSASVRTGWIVASAADETAVVTGHLPARLEPGCWADPGPSGSTEPQRKP